jgi:hypothetical protein
MPSYCASEFDQAKEGEAGNLCGFRCSLTPAWTNATSKKATDILKNALAYKGYLDKEKAVPILGAAFFLTETLKESGCI